MHSTSFHPKVEVIHPNDRTMTKRFIWNFEINDSCSLTLPVLDETGPAGLFSPNSRRIKNEGHDLEDALWEARFFWPEADIITLSGLAPHFLELSRYKIKHRSDVYYILPDADYNIKTRRGELVYKPILQQSAHAIAYGKKIKLERVTADIIQANGERINPRTLIQRVHQQGRAIPVDKEAVIYTFESLLNTQLEFARIHINNKITFSFSIESPDWSIMDTLSRQMVANQPASDYITFLKRNMES